MCFLKDRVSLKVSPDGYRPNLIPARFKIFFFSVIYSCCRADFISNLGSMCL